MTGAAPGGLTVLQCAMDKAATKTFQRIPGAAGWLKKGYSAGNRFLMTEHHPADLQGLADVIERTRREPRCFIVRGALTAAAHESIAAGKPWMLRRKLEKNGIPPSLAEVPRQWLMIDIDEWRMPAWADLVDDPETIIDHAVYELLPPPFHDAECFWQLSSSAGFVDGVLKAHLFFWLTEPADNVHIRAVLKQHAPEVCTSPFNAAQPHYIADPIIEGGTDPLPRRTGWRKGTETAVALPALATHEGTAWAQGDRSDTAFRSAGIAGALELMGDGPGLNGFHEPIRTAAMRYAICCQRHGNRDDAAFIETVREAVRSAPRDLAKRPSIDDYVSEAYLMRSIDGAFVIVAKKPEATVAAPDATTNRVSIGAAHSLLREATTQFRQAVERYYAARTEPPVAPPEAADGGNLAGLHSPAFWADVDQRAKDKAAPMPVHAIRVDVGAGKSDAARHMAAEMLTAMRAAGDLRNVAMAVPTHRLGDELAEAFERLPAALAADLTAAVWRGRTARPPGGADGDTMCADLDAVADAELACVPVQQAVCYRKAGGQIMKCAHHDACLFQKQRNRKADVWIVAHEMMFTEMPAVIGDIAFVIVDEAAWQDGLTGDDAAKKLTVYSLAQSDEVPGSIQDTLTLQDRRRQALDVLNNAPFGHITRGPFGTVMTPADASHASKLEYARKLKPAIAPGMPPKARKLEVERVKENRRVSRLALFWRGLAGLLEHDEPDFKSGWLALTAEDGDNGPAPTLLLKGRRDVHATWQLPTLHLDANLKLDLLRWHWPTVEITADVAVLAPHQHVYQVTDSPYAAKHFVGTDAAGRKNLRALHATICAIAGHYAPGRVLVVAQMAVEEALRDFGRTPPNVDLAHHNDIAGKDQWRDVAALIVIGRTAPKPGDVERVAEALTGRAVEPLPRWYARAQAAREMADGRWLTADADRHPDPVAEAVRWCICEGELVQIIGRPRGVNRTQADPVDVWVLADPVLPVALAGTLAAGDLVPKVANLMLAVGGIAFANPTDAAAAFPLLWDSREAAKKAFEREVGDKSLKEDILVKRFVPNLPALTYQRAGAGKRPATAMVDPTQHPDPAASLTASLGPLAWCKPADAPNERKETTPDAAAVITGKWIVTARDTGTPGNECFHRHDAPRPASQRRNESPPETAFP